MNRHELAKILLNSPPGEITCSVDISTCEQDSGKRVFGDFTEVNSLPSDVGFGSDVVMLLFEGSLN